MNNPFLILTCVVWIACGAASIASKEATSVMAIAFATTCCIWLVWALK